MRSACPSRYDVAERRPGDVEASWADCTRARDELGWLARKSVPQMLADHWNFARRHPDWPRSLSIVDRSVSRTLRKAS